MHGTITGRSGVSDARLTALIWASAMGGYLLLALGGATSLLDGGAACTTWPTCGPGLVGDLGNTAVIVALGHRIVAFVVGLLFAATLIGTIRHGIDRVTGAIALATVVYPFQVAIGALTATGTVTTLSTLHFVLGVTIFGLSIVALTWHLEATHAAPSSGAGTGLSSSLSGTSSASGGTSTSSGSTDASPAEEYPDIPTDGSDGFGPGDRVRAYLRLTKPRLMWLLALVAVAAMAMVAGPDLSARTAVATVAGGMLAVGASGTFNNVLERNLDQEMDRTADRPLVQGQIGVRSAVGFGVVLTALSVGVFVVFVNPLAAILALLAIGYYSVIYTLVLKPHTRKNIVIGGAVGAFPAVIGGAAVANTIPVSTVVLGLLIFLWTPAHFYNLALAYRDDYAAAGFPMLPVVRGETTTRRHILGYLGATLVGAVLLGAITDLGLLYTMTTVIVGGVFLWAVVHQYRERTNAAAFRTFHASNAYLGMVLLAIVVESVLV